MLWRVILALLVTLPLAAAEPRIVKVLPHLIDLEGKHTLSPSLYERDAYQVYLRENLEQVSALRFDIQYKASSAKSETLTLRIEVRGSKMKIGKDRVYETTVPRSRMFAKWAAIQVDKAQFSEVGEVLAWRATLWDGADQIAKQESFLW